VTERLFTHAEQRQIVSACPTLRDQTALTMLFTLGIRKKALRLFQLGDYDADRGLADFQWKNKPTHTLPILGELSVLLERYIAERSSDTHDWPTEYLLYPERIGPSWNPDLPKLRVLWCDRQKAMSESAVHRWWTRRLETAEVEHRRMHVARHTTIADFIRKGGRIEQAQLLAGHRRISTTVDTYGHVELSDLEATMRRQAKR